jgi:acetolactate synthase-1/3 small subunit
MSTQPSNASSPPSAAVERADSGRKRHLLSALVQNQPGVLAHVSGMFASRGFNIESLAVGETENTQLSRITVVVMGDDRHLDQVRKGP